MFLLHPTGLLKAPGLRSMSETVVAPPPQIKFKLEPTSTDVQEDLLAPRLDPVAHVRNPH